MTDQHPITPPLELLQEWCQQERNCNSGLDALKDLATQAARWGADQELEACCGFIGCEHSVAWSSKLRAARRHGSPSLKEQALALLDDASDRIDAVHENTIRRALEALPND